MHEPIANTALLRENLNASKKIVVLMQINDGYLQIGIYLGWKCIAIRFCIIIILSELIRIPSKYEYMNSFETEAYVDIVNTEKYLLHT